jgi:hypothetical protein
MLILLSRNEQGISALDLQKHIFPSGSSSMKSIAIAKKLVKYENDTHAPVYYQYDTYVAEFHKKGKCTHRQLQTNDAERSTLV